MKFTRLTKDNINDIKDYLRKSEISFCDISVGVKFMWRDEYVIDFSVFDDTLIMKEKGPNYDGAFYYPMGKNPLGALCEIEKYCRENFLPLRFCCIDEDKLGLFKDRYYDIRSYNDRDWDDYIYTAEQFKTYKGKKLSGQRNHVNKFKRLYPDYVFKKISTYDLERINDFLTEYEVGANLTPDARAEVGMTREYLDKFFELEQLGGYIEIDGKIVALSIGEIVGNTLIVHVEKAITEYDGVYPVIAQEFVKAFATNGVEYVNREEDCGDEGMRKSKTQYHPVEIKAKYAVNVKTLFERIVPPVLINTARLTVGEICESDKDDYYRLYTDTEINKWWGYDYHEDLNGEKATPDWFYNFQNSLKEREEEYSFAVKENGKTVGELVLHNFDYFGGVEMGFRFFKDCQGKGYATESALALKEYVKNTMHAKRIKSRCFKQNVPSKNLIGRLGLSQCDEDETRYFFGQDLN